MGCIASVWLCLLSRFLAFLGTCLVFYNIPFQYISLYFDCPWLLVLNDFQQGLFIAALFGFWIIFVSEHGPDREVQSHMGSYWKQMGVVLVASIFLFVYEFCERGIQVLYPFYSLWTSDFGITIAWSFITISAGSAILYLLIFLVTLIRVICQLRKKQQELAGSQSADARVKYAGQFTSLWFFLVVTSLVAVCSVLTVVLPSEMLLHHWQHNKTEYNVYSGILTGNYGMWNAYCIVMMWIYAPAYSTKGQSTPTAADPASLQKLISKKSLE